MRPLGSPRFRLGEAGRGSFSEVSEKNETLAGYRHFVSQKESPDMSVLLGHAGEFDA